MLEWLIIAKEQQIGKVYLYMFSLTFRMAQIVR